MARPQTNWLKRAAIEMQEYLRLIGQVAAVSVGNSVVFFLIFEIWFKIPLPKGPLESFFRLD